jgi:hypothetical protein
MKPQRIQLSRKKGWKKPANTVVVARPSRWGNPWKVGADGDAAKCVERYSHFVCSNIWSFPNRDAIKSLLKGKNLACWCKIGDPYHADVLITIANA